MMNRKELNLTTPVGLTTDTWTSCTSHGYITVTCHFVNSDWTLSNFMLATRKLDVRHTGENLAAVLNNIIIVYSI